MTRTIASHTLTRAGLGATLLLTTFLLGQGCPPDTPLTGTPAGTEVDPWVTIETDKGDIVIELFKNQSPRTVADFLRYVNESYYNDGMFHYVVAGQGIAFGSFDRNMAELDSKTPTNESDNGLRNIRGRVALSTPTDGNGDVAAVFINLTTNTALDYDPATGELVTTTVIGRVIEGMDVVLAIGEVETETNEEIDRDNVPVETIAIPRVIVGTAGEPIDDGTDQNNADDGDDNNTDDNADNDDDTNTDDDGSNDPPVADASQDRYIYPGVDALLYGLDSEDPDGDELTITWKQIDGRNVEVDNTNNGIGRFLVPDDVTAGQTFDFEVTADDGSGGIDTDTITLTVVLEPYVRLKTSMGDIVIKLYHEGAPITTLNFLKYVDIAYYDDTVFHRVIADYIIQGGGHNLDLTRRSPLYEPIPSETDASRSNVRGTIAMGLRGEDPDSAQSQFFINVVDNSDTLDTLNGGYTVFGEVVEGMDVVDAISEVETYSRPDPDLEGFDLEDVPVERITLDSALLIPDPTQDPAS